MTFIPDLFLHTNLALLPTTLFLSTDMIWINIAPLPTCHVISATHFAPGGEGRLKRRGSTSAATHHTMPYSLILPTPFALLAKRTLCPPSRPLTHRPHRPGLLPRAPALALAHYAGPHRRPKGKRLCFSHPSGTLPFAPYVSYAVEGTLTPST